MSTAACIYDARIPLPENYELTIKEKNPDSDIINEYKLTILRHIASGGSCLVYRGTLQKSVGDERTEYDVMSKNYIL